MPIRAVLWDADGVLQQVPGGWEALLAEAIGEEDTRRLLTQIWPVVAQEAIRGRADLPAVLDRVLVEEGLTDARDPIREVWGTIDRYDDSRALVESVRATGVTCHLATNQDSLRAAYMKERMGYEDLLDGAYYSCDLGAAKPETAYFELIVSDLGILPDELVLVDDLEANVVAAREVGLHGVHWHHREGLPALYEQLTAAGLRL